MDSLEGCVDMAAVAQIMNSEGPIVKAVYLPCYQDPTQDNKQAGMSVPNSVVSLEPQEITLDMTPRANMTVSKLGGDPTICASFPELGVVVMKRRKHLSSKKGDKRNANGENDCKEKNMAKYENHDKQDASGVQEEKLAESNSCNPNKLPKPFDKMKVHGPMLLVRMNEVSVPDHFTLEEYNKYKEQVEAFPPSPMELIESSEEDAEDGQESEEADTDTDSPQSKKVQGQTEEENCEQEDEDEDDEEEEEKEEEDFEKSEIFSVIKDRLRIIFQQQEGREPTEEEVNQLIFAMPGCADSEDNQENQDEQTEGVETDKAHLTSKNEEAKVFDESPGAEKDNPSDDFEKESTINDKREVDSSFKHFESEKKIRAGDMKPTVDDAKQAEEDNTIIEMMQNKIKTILKAQLGREPTEEEMGETFKSLAEDTDLHSDLLANQPLEPTTRPVIHFRTLSTKRKLSGMSTSRNNRRK